MFTDPAICWKDNRTEYSQPRKFVECSDNFLTQVIKKRCAVRPDTYKIGTLKSWQFGCNDDMIEFRILRGGSNVKNKMISLEDISRIQPWQKEGSSRAG